MTSIDPCGRCMARARSSRSGSRPPLLRPDLWFLYTHQGGSTLQSEHKAGGCKYKARAVCNLPMATGLPETGSHWLSRTRHLPFDLLSPLPFLLPPPPPPSFLRFSLLPSLPLSHFSSSSLPPLHSGLQSSPFIFSEQNHSIPLCLPTLWLCSQSLSSVFNSLRPQGGGPGLQGEG